jgi:hypothetical protein
MLRILLALLFVLALPTGALAQDTCTATTCGVVWNDAAFNAPTWSCTPGALSTDDAFIIPTGCALTVTGALTTTGTAATSGRVQVNSGGSLTLNTSTLATANAVVTLGEGGLIVADGGTFTVVPRFRSWGAATAAVSTTPPTDTDDFWRAGWVVPCGGYDDSANTWLADCGGTLATGDDITGDPEVIALIYPVANWAAAATANDRNVAESIAGISAASGTVGSTRTTGEFVQFVRPGLNYQDMSYENGEMYEIIDAGTTTDSLYHYIRLGVWQRKVGQATYTQNFTATEREIQTTTSTPAIAKGDPSFTMTATTIIDATNGYQGRWIYWAGGPTTLVTQFGIRQQPVLIGRTANAADTMFFADPRGAPFDVADTTAFYVSPAGIRPGDPFIVIDPWIVQSEDNPSGSPDGTGAVMIASDVTLRGGHFNNTASVQLGVSTSPTTTTEYVSFWDNCRGSGCGALGLSAVAGTTANHTLRYVNIAGGTTTANTGHGFTAGDTGLTVNVTAEDLACRYLMDDCHNEGGVVGSTVIGSLKRIVDDYRQDGASSDSLWELSGTNSTTTLAGALCKDCARDTSTPTAVLDSARGTTITVSDLMLVGVRVPLIKNPAGTPVVSMTGLTWISSTEAQGNAQVITTLRNAVMRDIADTSTAANMVVFNPGNGNLWSRVLMKDINVTGSSANSGVLAFAADHGATRSVFTDIAIIDSGGDPNDAFLRTGITGGDTFPVTLKRVTLGASDPFYAARVAAGTLPAVAFYQSASGASSYGDMIVDGLLVQGHKSLSGGLFIQDATGRDGPDWTHGPCFFDNQSNAAANNDLTGPAPLTAAIATSMVRFTDLGLVAPEVGNFSPRRGGVAHSAGCGALGSAGVSTLGWTHYITGLPAETLDGIIPVPGGGGGSRTGPRAF